MPRLDGEVLGGEINFFFFKKKNVVSVGLPKDA